MKSFTSRIPRLLDYFQPSGTAILFASAVVIGLGTAAGAVFFIKLIALVQGFFFSGEAGWHAALGRWVFLLAPLLGGLLAGPVIHYFAQEAKGHGVPEVMQAIALNGGRIRPRVVVAKVAASALCIGSGGSAGREGPIVQVGAALGSTIGQWLHFSETRIRNLVACGAAAGIAATFNAPIAGVIFSMEIILGELHLGDLGGVVISAVTASTLARVFLGESPAFSIPHYGVKSPWEVLLYVVLGVAAAVVAVAFIRMLYWFEDRFDAWRFPDALKPAVGGLLLGALGFFYPMVLGLGFVSPSQALAEGLPMSASIPQVFGSGFPVIESALVGQLSLGLLIALVVLKPLATSLTLGSGNSGGVFAPALFMGAALGGAFGKLVELVAPGATAGPGAFAVVGMAAVFAGAARAPFTAILIVFEMTDDYRMIIPLMAGVIVSLIIAERLFPDSIYTLKLTRRGIHLRRGRDVDVMESVLTGEVMREDPASVPPHMPVTLLGSEFMRTGRHGFPVVSEDGSLFGVVSLEDYRRVASKDEETLEKMTVKDIATRDVVTVFPDEPVGTALRRMAPRDLSRMPVVDRENPLKLLGVIRRNDIVRAYDIGVLRREERRHRAAATQAVNHERVEFIEVRIVDGAGVAGKSIAELALPRQAVLVSVRRGRDLLIPHGDTKLAAGDVVTALVERAQAEAVRAALA